MVLPEHGVVMSAMGTEVPPGKAIGLAVSPGKATGATLGTVPEAGAYAASNPAAFAEPSDENVTYSWPLGDVTDITDLEPVIVSTSGADDEVPEYILTKS